MTDPNDPHEEIDLRPIAESPFAVEHGLIRSAPDVAVDGHAVRAARADAGLTTADIAREMTLRGYTTDAATVGALEDSSAYRMRPREARLLAALLDLPLTAIEAGAEPWPIEPDDLASLLAAGADVLVLGADAVVRTSTGSHLGLLRCAGDPTVLGARTYRLAAATLLNGAWSHLTGALLVTSVPPHRALAVDALDCVTRSHAPTGLLGYSRLAEPEPIADALASYDRAYAISWSDPPPLTGVVAAAEDQVVGRWAEQLGTMAARLDDEGRRSRQPGKRPGYEAAADWLRTADPGAVAALVDELATASGETAENLLRNALDAGTDEAGGEEDER
ncbi:MAG: hypothetical protein ACRD2C_03200 [Acidimicrobiales bacterium]